MIFVLLLLAFCLRLPLLGASFWLDEAAQFLESVRPLSQQFEIREDFQPPLMHLLTFLGIRLGELIGLGETEWWVRFLPSLLPGLVTIWATYRLALSLKLSRRAAWLSALLLATSSLHIFYSQELRPYSLPAMLGILATCQLLELLAAKKRAAPFFVIFSILGLYASYLYPFLLFGQFVYLIQRKLAWRRLMIFALLISVSFLPWLPKFFEQLQTGQALRLSMPGWDQVVSLPQVKTALLIPLKFVFGVSDLEPTLGYAFLSAAVFMPLFYLLYLATRQKTAQLHFFLYLLVLPVLSSWLFSFFIPVLQAKRVLFALPLFYLLIAALISKFKQQAPQTAKILVSTLLIINLFSTYAYWTKPELQREDWRGLSQEITNKFSKETTALVFAFDQPFAPWRFYDQTGFKTFSSGSFYSGNLANPAKHFKELTEYRQLLLFDYLRDLTDPDDLLVKVILDFGFQEIGVLDYPVIGFIRIYSQTNLAQDL